MCGIVICNRMATRKTAAPVAKKTSATTTTPRASTPKPPKKISAAKDETSGSANTSSNEKTASSSSPVAALVVGDPAPDFSLPDHDGRVITLASLLGKRVILYFYPKDDTPGCTREACGFNENLAQLTGLGAVVIGVSRDSAAAHTRFRKKYSLDFALLTDTDAALHQRYGAWGEKNMYGKKTVGPIRTTVLIDTQGRVARVFNAVKVDGHVAKVIEALAAVQ